MPTQNTSSEKLSVLICKDSFFYLKLDPIGRIITFHKEDLLPTKSNLLEKLLLLWEQDQISRRDDLDIRMALLTNQFTLVPVTLYAEEHKQLYYERLNYFPNYQALWVDSITTRDFAKVVFGVEKIIAKTCAEVVEPGFYLHIITSLTRLFFQDYGHLEGTHMLSYVRGGYECIIVFESGKLRLANVFETFNDDDVLYYIAMVVNQLEMTPLTVSLYLAGDWYPSTPRHKWLSQKFKDIRFTQSKNHLLNRSAEKKNLKAHELYDLLSIWS